MIVLYILTALLFLLILILLARIEVIINTEKGIYKAYIGSFISIRLIHDRHKFYIGLRAFFISLRFSMPRKRGNQTDHQKPVSVNKKKRRDPLKGLRFLKALRKAVRIRTFYLDLDTGDYPLNAQLIPAAKWINTKNVTININFEDRNQMECGLYTRPVLLIWYLIKTNFNK